MLRISKENNTAVEINSCINSTKTEKTDFRTFWFQEQPTADRSSVNEWRELMCRIHVELKEIARATVQFSQRAAGHCVRRHFSVCVCVCVFVSCQLNVRMFWFLCVCHLRFRKLGVWVTLFFLETPSLHIRACVCVCCVHT